MYLNILLEVTVDRLSINTSVKTIKHLLIHDISRLQTNILKLGFTMKQVSDLLE
jgi:hypothetical protein